MTVLESLIKHFEHFPGIGSRQAKRFAFHLLTLPTEDVTELSELIRTIRSRVISCPSCGHAPSHQQKQHNQHLYFTTSNHHTNIPLF